MSSQDLRRAKLKDFPNNEVYTDSLLRARLAMQILCYRWRDTAIEMEDKIECVVSIMPSCPCIKENFCSLNCLQVHKIAGRFQSVSSSVENMDSATFLPQL